MAKLAGPTVPSHAWEKMLGAKKPDVGPLAGFVPEEFYFAEFRSVVKLHEVLGVGDMWSGHIFTQVLGNARSQQTAERKGAVTNGPRNPRVSRALGFGMGRASR